MISKMISTKSNAEIPMDKIQQIRFHLKVIPVNKLIAVNITKNKRYFIE